MQDITDEKTSWTDGMKALRKLGFTAYPKEHVAYYGRFWPRLVTDVSISVKHDRNTGKWEFEFQYEIGERAFRIGMEKKIERYGITCLESDFSDFKREFVEKHFQQIKILKNIFLNNKD